MGRFAIEGDTAALIEVVGGDASDLEGALGRADVEFREQAGDRDGKEAGKGKARGGEGG